MIDIINKNWKIENIEAIFFDKDGTIIDSNLYWGEIVKRRAWAILNSFSIQKRKDEIFSQLCKTMGFSLKKNKLLKKGPTGISSREIVIAKVQNFLIKKLKINIDSSEIESIFKNVHNEFLNCITSYIKIIPDAYDFLKKLKDNNIKLALITSDSINNTLSILKNIKLENFFDIIIGRENCEEPKTSGKPALIAINRLNVNPENTIVIGDAPMDKIMADNAKLRHILVATGQLGLNDLKSITKYTIRSLRFLKIKLNSAQN